MAGVFQRVLICTLEAVRDMKSRFEKEKTTQETGEQAEGKAMVTVENSAPKVELDERPRIPGQLSVLPLRNMVPYPLAAMPLTVGRPQSVRLVNDALLEQRTIALVALKDSEVEEPGPEDVYRIGTAAIVHQLRKAPDGTLLLFVQGLERIRLAEFVQTEPYMRANVELIPDQVEESIEMEALTRNLLDLLRR